jgi:hypothetical protein
VDNYPQFKKSARRKPKPSRRWCGGKVSVQVVAVRKCCVEQKIPRGVMAWEALMTRPWGWPV